MQVVGDPEGVAALKALAAEHRDYLKFLITEAKSSSDHVAAFRTADNVRWEVVFHPERAEFEVRHPRTNSPTTTPPPGMPDSDPEPDAAA